MLLDLGPQERSFYHHSNPYSRFGHPRGGSTDPSKFQPVSRTSPNHQNVSQGSQMTSKMSPKSMQNTSFFQSGQCVSHTVNTMLFFTSATPKCDQNHQKLNPVTCTVSLVSQILKMSLKWHQMGSQKAPKIRPKSEKISIWTPVCPMGCPATRTYALRVPKWGPKAPQMTHLVPKWGPKAPQMTHLGTPKGPGHSTAQHRRNERHNFFTPLNLGTQK